MLMEIKSKKEIKETMLRAQIQQIWLYSNVSIGCGRHCGKIYYYAKCGDIEVKKFENSVFDERKDLERAAEIELIKILKDKGIMPDFFNISMEELYNV